MRKITFRFPDENSLKQFANIIAGTPLQLSVTELLITCECGEPEIELAEKGFGATVVYIQMKS
jgi:hypothetical protein